MEWVSFNGMNSEEQECAGFGGVELGNSRSVVVLEKNETWHPFIKELITQVRPALDYKHPREPFSVSQFLVSRKVFFFKEHLHFLLSITNSWYAHCEENTDQKIKIIGNKAGRGGK